MVVVEDIIRENLALEPDVDLECVRRPRARSIAVRGNPMMSVSDKGPGFISRAIAMMS